ncbi:hypothetical protein K439DRAFT_1625410 [Ramaria rubella]|nr:hypothetical protein K439DRAFT_1625410 [Ramaria rubella]
MRFLAIVSVFFAVTQVAFAALLLPPSHLIPRLISTSACVGAVGIGIEQHLVDGEQGLSALLELHGHPGALQQTAVEPQVIPATYQTTHDPATYKFETTDRGKHTFTFQTPGYTAQTGIPALPYTVLHSVKYPGTQGRLHVVKHSFTEVPDPRRVAHAVVQVDTDHGNTFPIHAGQAIEPATTHPATFAHLIPTPVPPH